MIIKVNFTSPNTTIPIRNQKELNSYIHKCIGHNNKYHDTFSDYSISSLQGGKLINGNELSFEGNVPNIVITSENTEFISDIMSGIQSDKFSLFSMKFKNFEISDFNVDKYCDTIITISPIIVKNKNGHKIAFDNPEWLSILTKQLKDKLAHKGIIDNTFRLEIRNIERAKIKKIWVGDVFNICSFISLKVYGHPDSRRTLYNMGFGGSTGSGFGTIKIYEN